MKKILMVFILTLLVVLSAGCGKGKSKLYVMNWEDYIDEDLIGEFEKANDCEVIYEPVSSNEDMYKNIVNKKARYDIVVPSDYMIEKLQKENLLVEIDKTKLTNYEDGMFIDKLEERIKNEGSAYNKYFIPYFWGTLGIMYSTNAKYGNTVKEAVEANGFKVLFDHTLLPSGANVGMYDCARDAFAAAELYLGYDLNTTNAEELKACRDLLKKNSYDYGTDDLKVAVSTGTLAASLVYSGDYFDRRNIYIEEEKNVEFGLYAPTDYNNVFFDGMVIPTTSRNTELAHKFIDFFLNTDISVTNTDFVGYAPVIEEVREAFLDMANEKSEKYDEYYAELLAIDAYNPALVVKGCVYRFISAEFDATIDDYFFEAKSK